MNDTRYNWIPLDKPKLTLQSMDTVRDYNVQIMNIPVMWKFTKGAGVRVAVLDTGLARHKDLPQPQGRSFIEGYVYDTQGHSTHCTGLIGAQPTDNGIIGIAPECTLINVTVLDAEGGGTVDSIVQGVRWAVDVAQADIISMSLGISVPSVIPELKEVCDYAYSKGVAVFAAAGNEGGPVGQPASYDSVFAVAAVDSKLKRASFSDYGDQIDFAAGGVNVYSTYLNDGYAVLSGTSQATPALAAVAALIISKNKMEGRKLTPDELRVELDKIAYNPDNVGGRDIFDGKGIPIFTNSENPLPVPVSGFRRWLIRIHDWLSAL